MSQLLFSCLFPSTPAPVSRPKPTVKSEAQKRAHRDWYWRNVERERAKARARYHAKQ